MPGKTNQEDFCGFCFVSVNLDQLCFTMVRLMYLSIASNGQQKDYTVRVFILEMLVLLF